MNGVHMIVAAVSLDPDPNGLPGGEQLAGLIDGLGFWALLACLAGLVIGAALWGLGSLSRNQMAVGGGKAAVGVSLAGALVIGAAAALINFFFSTGGAM